MSLKPKDSDFPKIIKTNKEATTKPKENADNFNNFFCCVAPRLQNEISYAFRLFQNYFSEPCNDNYFISPCSEDKTSKIISEFSNYKATGINSILLTILKLAKQSISKHFFIFLSHQVFSLKNLKQQRLHQ